MVSDNQAYVCTEHATEYDEVVDDYSGNDEDCFFKACDETASRIVEK